MLQHLDGLNTALRALDAHHDAGAIRDRALAEVPQNIGVQQDIGVGIVGNDETKTLGRIKPLNATMHDLHDLIFFRH